MTLNSLSEPCLLSGRAGRRALLSAIGKLHGLFGGRRALGKCLRLQNQQGQFQLRIESVIDEAFDISGSVFGLRFQSTFPCPWQ